MIQRHILNAAKLTSPYKMIAADANNDQKISASDLVALRKLILGLETEINGNTSWRFVPKTFLFADPSQPWPFAEIVELNDIDVNLMNNDFVAIKTGDVNGTVSNTLSQKAADNRTRNYADIVFKDQYFEAGRYVNVPVTLDHNGSFTAIQTGLKIDTRHLEFAGIMDESIVLPKESYRYDLNTGMLYIAHLESSPLNLRPGAVLFILQFKTLESGKLSKALSLDATVFENFLVDENIAPVYLNVRMSDDLEALTVNQNTPNPFAEYTEVKYFIADDGMVEITIYDNAGIKIFNQVRHCNAGVNQLRIDREQLGDKRGVFFLHIATGERKEIKKLLRLN
ncbi:MAG: T9SS type A sorting domain-containing protein [Saprospiraceae bacterium]|nr:T9SS type A sorting domain-containing protein [Saprospiraceae bacterium]